METKLSRIEEEYAILCRLLSDLCAELILNRYDTDRNSIIHVISDITQCALVAGVNAGISPEDLINTGHQFSKQTGDLINKLLSNYGIKKDSQTLKA